MFNKISSRKYIFLDYFFIAAGALVQALAMRLFLIPGLLVSGGISGASQIINYFTKWPIGIMVLVGNLPLLVLGWRYLGEKRFAVAQRQPSFSFSVFTDGLSYFLPKEGATADKVLAALYGGVLLGIGLGLVYRGRGTSGGSDILAASSITIAGSRCHRVISSRMGWSCSAPVSSLAGIRRFMP